MEEDSRGMIRKRYFDVYAEGLEKGREDSKLELLASDKRSER